MPLPIVAGAQLTCIFGAAPSAFVPTPNPKPVMFENKPVGTIMDFAPMVNIMPFAMCNAPANPQGMAKPVPTPCPCVPVITGPWVPVAPTKLVNNKPILLQGSIAMCVWAGVIQATNPGTTKEQVS